MTDGEIQDYLSNVARTAEQVTGRNCLQNKVVPPTARPQDILSLLAFESDLPRYQEHVVNRDGKSSCNRVNEEECASGMSQHQLYSQF